MTKAIAASEAGAGGGFRPDGCRLIHEKASGDRGDERCRPCRPAMARAIAASENGAGGSLLQTTAGTTMSDVDFFDTNADAEAS